MSLNLNGNIQRSKSVRSLMQGLIKCPKWGSLFAISLILTLNLSAQFSLSYDANLGDGSMTDTVLLSSDSIALPLNEFAHFGYHFTHWNSVPDGSGFSYFPNDSFAIANTDTMLYAQWGKYCGGDGSALDPWQICNTEALILLSHSAEDWGDTIIQTGDILFSNNEGSYDWDGDGIIGSLKDPAGFSPIGNTVKAFSGHYDGQGFRIDSLYTNSTNDFTGLFGIADSALIENVVLNRAEINGFNYIGGIIGRAQNNTRLGHLFFDGYVYGRAFVGGIVGSLEEATLEASCFMGELNAGGSMAGGLAGRIAGSAILNSYSSGYVVGELQNVGGIAGFVQNNSVIKNTFSTAGVSGVKYVGSFVGILSASTVTNCYATGVALGDGFVGGFMGINGSSTIVNSYYDTESTWLGGNSIGVKLLTKNGFRDYATNFNTWDFGADEAHPWVQSASGRPYLYWQKIALSNALMSNTDSGYVFSQGLVADQSTVTKLVGIRYKKLSDSNWTYQLDSAGEGTIMTTLSGIDKAEYLVQPMASDGVLNYYGDMTRMTLHTLAYDANGGVGTMVDTLLTSQDSVTLSNNQFLISGYKFIEWNTVADGSGAVFLDGGQFTVGEQDTLLYAMWGASDFAINYVLDGGVNAAENLSSYTVDSLVIFSAATKRGFSFDGWYAEDTFMTRVDSIPLASKADTILYAKWNIDSYDIIYHANNGSGLNTLETDTFNKTVVLTSVPFATPYQTFKYWTTSDDETGDIYNDNDSYTYGDTSLHLYAQWQKYCGGYGTQALPWEICTPEALVLLSQSSQDWDNYFVQTGDVYFGDSTTLVDWNGDALVNDEAGFLPLGNSVTPFSGNYNGANYTIENLFIDRSTEDNVALFAYATGDTISAVGLVNVTINGRNNTGALVGYSEVDAIYNCFANGLITGSTNVGGLVAYSSGASLKNSYSSCGIVGEQNVGGFIGSALNSTVSNSYSSGVVLSPNSSGGFIGNVSASNFTSCYFDTQTAQQDLGTAVGDVAGLSALTTEDFKETNNFAGWTIGIGIELLPWMPNEDGRPYLMGQKNAVSNGQVLNDYAGYILSNAYADSVTYAPTSTGIRYRNTSDSLWVKLTTVNGAGYILNHFSGLSKGNYWVQAFSQSGDSLTYGDMTQMSLSILDFDANGGSGVMNDTLLVVGDSIVFPSCTFTNNGKLHAEWNTKADGTGTAFSPKGEFAIAYNDSILYAQWRSPFATDDYFDGIVGGSRIELDVTRNDTIGGVLYGQSYPVEIIETGTSGTISIEGNQIIYSPPLIFSGPDFFTYLVDYNGAVDTAEVVILVFDAPGNMVNADCFVDMPKYEWEVSPAGQDPHGDIHDWTTPLVGDLFGDEYPEVVAVKGTSGYTDDDIVIYYGSATPLESGRVEINNVPDFNAAATPMAIAKVETSSGLQPTLFLSAVDRLLYAFDPQIGNSTPLWSSSETYCKELGNREGAFIGVADFNNDNQQEVYAANRIYNAATGDLLCSGSDSTDIGHFVYAFSNSGDYSTPTHHMMHTVTGDFDSDGDLELAAGRYVFDVDINNGVMPIMSRLPDSVSSDPNMIEDGPTVVADIDLDGDLDVIVTHQTTNYDFYCYVWDGQTPTLIAEKYIRNDSANIQRQAVGIPFVGDLNGDGKPEIAFTTSNRQYAFSYSDTSTELQEYYILKHTDESGFTGLTLFDFNNDDIAEIVYRDETELRIINASGISHVTGNDTLNADGTPILYNLATYPCKSGTQSEFAVVVDIDLDDQAEIIVTDNTSDNKFWTSDHHLNIFESGANSKWVGARPVWNQYGYNVTNVNNDLTIPTYAINNSMAIEVDSFSTVRPFNHFLQQMGNVTLTGENVILTPDLYMSNSFYTNDGTTGTLTFDIINQGDADFSQEDSTVSFYCGDPAAGGTLLSVDSIRADIAWEDTLKSQVYTFPADPTVCPRIYVRLNDNGSTAFPDSLNRQQECNYDNNTMLAAIFEVTSHFQWNGYDLDSVMLNTGDTSDVAGMAYMLISRGDTIAVLPELPGYLFVPLRTSLPWYAIANDTLTLHNVQENGMIEFTAYKIPEVIFTPKTVVYNQFLHSGDVSVPPEVMSDTELFYRNSNDSIWTVDKPDSVGYYAMKVVTEANYLYAAYTDSLDSVLVITPRPIIFDLTVDDKSYDGSDSVVSFTAVNDVLNGDILTLDADNSDLHFTGNDAGTYKVFPSGGWSISGKDAHNYFIQPYDTVSATITKHLLNISANDSLKLYDGDYFYGGNGITCVGFALGEDTSVLVGTLSYSNTASAQGALEKGVYAISVDGFSSHNYDIVFNDGALIVEKRYLLIEFGQSDVITYGDSIDLLHYTLANVVNLAPGDTFIHQELGSSGDISTTRNLQTGVHKLNLGDAYVQNQWGDTVTSNYDVSFSPEHITVLPKEVYIVNALAENKIYDANADAAISGAILSGLIDGDTVSLNDFSVGQFIQTDVGTNIEVFYNNTIAIQGLDAHNYILIPFSTSLYANIYPKELTLSGTVAEDKMYDGDSVALVRGALLNGVIGADNVFLLDDTTGVFEQANVGNTLDVKTDITINGSKSHNYYLTQTLDLFADITPSPLIIYAVDTTKIYDAQPFLGGNGITWSGFVLGEDTTDLMGELSFLGNAQMAVDTGHYQITVQGFSATNYTITYVPEVLTVNHRVIHIDYHGQDTIVYGNTVTRLDYKPTILDLALEDTFIVDFIGFDNDTSSSGHLNVGARVLTSGDAQILNAAEDTVTDNYVFVFNPQTLKVLPKVLNVIDAVAKGKIYDNTLVATIDSAILDSTLLGDNVFLVSSTSGVFVDENVGQGIVVNADMMHLEGVDLNNYTLIQPPLLSADITKRPIAYSLDGIKDKVYDGTDTLINSVGAITSDTILVDSVVLHYALSFEDENANSNLTIVADTWSISGVNIANYLLLPYHGDSANILPEELTIRANDTTKIYDGIPFYGGNGIVCTGFVTGEDTTDLSGALSYLGTSQGALDTAYYTILPNGFSANNYNINYVSGALHIDPRMLHINYGGIDTVTYSDAIDMMDYSPVTIDLAMTDTFKISSLGFGTDTSSSGHLVIGNHSLEIGKSFILNALQDTVTENYIFVFNPPVLTVEKKDLQVIGALAHDKIYDNTTVAIIDSANLDSVLIGDDVSLAYSTSGVFADENVGLNIRVTPKVMSIIGADIANYNLIQPPLLSADITKRPIAYSLDSISDKIYDGTDTLMNSVGAITSDTLLVDSVVLHYTLSFEDENADSNLTIDADTWYITAVDTANYLLLPYQDDSASILPRNLFIKANYTTKVYDGVPFVGGNGITWSGFVAGEDTTDLLGDLRYFGASQSATDTGYYAIELEGFTAKNYNINFKSDSLRINPRLLIINYGGGDTITYGDAIDMLNYTPLTTDLALTDTFKFESIGFANALSTAGHLTVGVHPLAIGDAFILNAAQDTVTHNYIFAFNPPSLWVNPKVIAVINALAEDKTYDKSTDAVVSNAALSGVEVGDIIFLQNATRATFANDDVAANITVIPDSVYLTGEDSANYILMPLPLLQADIYKRRLTYVVDTVSDKIYDATDSLINRISASTSDTILADSITFSFALSFSQKEAGIDGPIADDIWSIAGAEAGNYQLLPYAGDSATIFPKALFITANDTVKTYDSYPFYGGNGITWDGFVAGEDTSDLFGSLNYVGSSQFALDTGNYEIVPSGFRANNYDITYVSDTLRINSRVLHINYGGADTLWYGEVVDLLDYSPVTLDLAPNDRFYAGILSFGDKLSSAGLLTAGNHNLAIGDAYILNAGADSVSHNYIFTFNPPALFVKEKVLTIINATAQNKVYDNTTEAIVNGATLDGVITGDGVILTNSRAGIFADENVGLALLVSTDSMLLSGVDRRNYILAPQPILTADIIPRPVLYILDSVENKVYDGTDSLCNEVSAFSNDTIAADSLILEFSLSFEDTRAGDNWSINTSTWKLHGLEKSNYTLLPFLGDSAAIVKADLTFEVADTFRYYGELNPRFDYVVSGFINNEGLSDIDLLPSFSCVQNLKTFVGEYTEGIQLLAGNDDNYNFIFKNGNLTINKVQLDVNYMAEDTLIYGGEVDANDYSVVGNQMVNNDSLYLGALQFGNDTSSSGHYNIGHHVILPGEITAMDEAGVIDCSVNYEITFNPSFIVYVPKSVTVSVEAQDKEYDGDASAVLNYKHINDLFMGDDVFLDLNTSDLIGTGDHRVLNALFQNKLVQSGKRVTPVACHFSGTDCHNYDLILPDLDADITPRKITWFGNALDKVYDGDTRAELDSIGLLRIIEGDDIGVNYTIANFAQRDAGDNLVVRLSQISTNGADKSNYDLDEFYELRATIHKAKLAVKLDDFTYVYGDALPDPSFAYDGLVNGEEVAVIDIQPQLLSAISSKSDVGYYTLPIHEAYDNNYEFTYRSGQVTILPRPLEIRYVGANQLCANELVDVTAYAADNLAMADVLKTLEFEIVTLEDDSLRSGEKYHIERGTTVIENEAKRNVNDNYTITMGPSEVEILEIPGPALGNDLEFCGICEYDFDGGEGTSYLWSTGDTTRHISMLGNFRGDVWVRVGNENGCFNTDTVEISVESKYLKDFIIAFLYPNPSNGKFKVKLSHHVTDVAYIYNMSGNLIKKIDVDADEFIVDIFVPDGAYLLEILDAKEIFLIENSVVIGVE